MKIAITGIAGGGKTVFLSSLVWQLMEIESADFLPGSDLKIADVREIPVKEGTGEPFPFDRYRDALSHERIWPAKTVDCYRFACDFRRREKKRFSLSSLKKMEGLPFRARQRLDFFDFPGERIADAAVASFRHYAEWSDHILRHFRSHSDYRDAVAPYLSLLNDMGRGKTHLSEAQNLVGPVAHAYKRTMGRLIYGYRPLITPSTFLLGQEGDMAVPAGEEELAKSRPSGLDLERQFAPLPRKIRYGYPELARDMAANYQLYRKELALPLFREIGKAESLVILVDIPSILAGGVGRYNDNRQILLDLFDALRPDSTLGARLLKVLTFWRKKLRRVAFVATKADLVHPEDIRNGRMDSLLKQMTGRARRMLPEVEFAWFSCSAVRSTRPGKRPGRLVGRPTYRNPLRREKEFDVSSLPESWPRNWKAGDFRFQSVLPEVHRNIQIPPDHMGLDRLLRFLLH